jgi:hypothetical protein
MIVDEVNKLPLSELQRAPEGPVCTLAFLLAFPQSWR